MILEFKLFNFNDIKVAFVFRIWRWYKLMKCLKLDEVYVCNFLKKNWVKILFIFEFLKSIFYFFGNAENIEFFPIKQLYANDHILVWLWNMLELTCIPSVPKKKHWNLANIFQVIIGQSQSYLKLIVFFSCQTFSIKSTYFLNKLHILEEEFLL